MTPLGWILTLRNLRRRRLEYERLVLEVEKLRFELRALRKANRPSLEREPQEATRIQAASPEDVQKYGWQVREGPKTRFRPGVGKTHPESREAILEDAIYQWERRIHEHEAQLPAFVVRQVRRAALRGARATRSQRGHRPAPPPARA